jgi:SAM-dependent methyltransferase
VHFFLSDAYKPPFQKHTFDLVITRSVLVLLDRAMVLPAWRNLLRPGGQAIFVENMNNHPVLRLWRRITHTQWGRYDYLSTTEINTFGAHFQTVQAHYLGLTLPLAGLTGRFEPSLTGPLIAVDRRLLASLPSLSRFAWLAAVRCSV